MFTVIFHDEAEKEFFALPATIRAKMSRLLEKLEANPRLLREPDTKPLGNGLFESGEHIFLLRIFIKKTSKTPLTREVCMKYVTLLILASSLQLSLIHKSPPRDW